jgi:mannose-6-phosphate isomerase-like protein (cupin superfamily)
MPEPPIDAAILLRNEQTGAAVSAVAPTVPGGWRGPPLHHHDFDERFYVLEAELTFQIRDAVVTRRAGELAFAPRGVHHTWANHSAAPVTRRSR